MPYTGPDDNTLPSNVKKLGSKQRRQWVNVFNSTYKRCNTRGDKDCEAQAFRNANGVLKNASTTFAGLLGGEHALGRSFIELSAAEPPETINVFPAPGTYKHPVWGDIEVTQEGNEEFVENFNAHVYQEHVPIDAEHETKLSGAVGYMKKLKMNDDGSIEAEVEWTDRGEKLIEDDSFKYISPEWYEQWTDPATKTDYNNVLIGAALTTRPFFKGLRSLVASEGRWYDLDEHERTPLLRSTAEGISYNDLQTVVMSAARHEYPGIFGTPYGGWVTDLWDDYAIICSDDGKYYRLNYTYEGKEIAFDGQPREVQRRTTWEDAPMSTREKEGDQEHTNRMSERSKDKGGTMAVDITKLNEKQKSRLARVATALFGHDESEKENGEEEEEETPEQETPAVEQPPESSQEESQTEGEPNTASESKIASLQSELAKEREARKASDQRLAGLEKTAREARFRDIILGRDEPSVLQAKESGVAVRPMVGDHAAKLALMSTLAETRGEDSTEFKAYVAMEREHANQIHAAGTFNEIGYDPAISVGESPKAQFEAKVAAERAKDANLSEADAIAKVAREDPKLYDAYDRAVSGRKGSHVGG